MKSNFLPLPSCDCYALESAFELGPLGRHDFQPAEVIFEVAFDVGDVQGLPESSLKSGRGPHFGEHCGEFIPDRRRDEAVHIFGVYPYLQTQRKPID